MEKQRGSLVRTHTPKMTPYKLKGYHSCRHAVCVLGCLSCVQLFVTLWTVIYKAPLSMGFTRQEYCSGLSSSPPGDLPDLKVKHTSLIPFALAVRFLRTTIAEVLPQGARSPSLILGSPSWGSFIGMKAIEGLKLPAIKK